MKKLVLLLLLLSACASLPQQTTGDTTGYLWKGCQNVSDPGRCRLEASFAMKSSFPCVTGRHAIYSEACTAAVKLPEEFDQWCTLEPAQCWKELSRVHKDARLCLNIAEVSQRSSCVVWLASVHSNLSMCELLNESSLVQNCIAESAKTDAECESLTLPYLVNCNRNIILSRGKSDPLPDPCLLLNATEEKYECYLATIPSEKVKEFCDVLQSPESETVCTRLLARTVEDCAAVYKTAGTKARLTEMCVIIVAQKTNNTSVCTLEGLPLYLTDRCFERAAKDIPGCAPITNQTIKNQCYQGLSHNVLPKDKAIDVCNQISDKLLMENCFLNLAVRTKDPALCDQSGDKSYCTMRSLETG